MLVGGLLPARIAAVLDRLPQLGGQRLGTIDRGCQHDISREGLERGRNGVALRHFEPAQNPHRGGAQPLGFNGIEAGLKMTLKRIRAEDIVDRRRPGVPRGPFDNARARLIGAPAAPGERLLTQFFADVRRR